jgi:peptidoglycan/xylan/chitin deacetylase (PgdA/CDA1 family)
VRDFVGYGNRPPAVEWPDGARVALSLCLNYEEGAELSIALGDAKDEVFSEWGTTARYVPEDERRRSDESFTEYGSRVGVWRLLDILDRHDAKGTIFACAQAFERNPLVAREVVLRGHEVCSHGYRWENHFGLT